MQMLNGTEMKTQAVICGRRAKSTSPIHGHLFIHLPYDQAAAYASDKAKPRNTSLLLITLY